MLAFLAQFAALFGIAVNTINNLTRIQDANISPEAREMLSATVIGIGVLLAVLPYIGLFGGPYGIAVGFLVASTISYLFNYLIPIIIQTAETIENRGRQP